MTHSLVRRTDLDNLRAALDNGNRDSILVTAARALVDNARDAESWKVLEPPAGPWILVLPRNLGSAAPAFAKQVNEHFDTNPPLIFFANQLDDVKFLDEAQMRELGWARA